MIELLSGHEMIDFQKVGAKAFRLKNLQDSGYRVPAFFCISVSCHQSYLLMQKEEQHVFEKTLQMTLAEYVKQHFSETKLFSVRSSASSEDGEHASYAGQYRSILRVSVEKLSDAVLRCWKAASCHTVQIYRENRDALEKKNHTDSGHKSADRRYTQKKENTNESDGDTNRHEKEAIGIIIQELIEADLSGVAFSANPQGILNEAVIICGASTGDQVVEDKTPVTTYYHNWTDENGYYEQADEAPLLSVENRKEILFILKELSKNNHVDIEFAIKDGVLWILQERPVTTLQNNSEMILDSSNISESYGGLSLPLTISFAKHVYTQVFTGLARRCMPTDAVVEQYKDTLQKMVNNANGRMYYQISNWYTILKFLPFQKKIVPVWQKMLGVEQKEYDQTKNKLTKWEKIQTYRRILFSAIGIPTKMKSLEIDFKTAETLFNEKFHHEMNHKELVELFEQLSEIVLRNWDVTLLNDMYAFLFTGLLEKQFKKAGFEDEKGKCNQYLSGEYDIESMKPVLAIQVLVAELQADSDLREKMESLKNDESVQIYLEEASPFANRLCQYLENYGDRCHEELKLETKTFRSHPFGLIQLLLSYSQKEMGSVNITDPISEQPQEINELKREFRFFRRIKVQWIAKKARLGIANREASRLNRGRIFGMVRKIFLKMGENLHKAGLIEDVRDVFYLTMEELLLCTKDAANAYDFKLYISDRKEKYRSFSALPPYSRLIFSGDIFDKHPQKANRNKDHNDNGIYRGTPCSPGAFEGEVVVVDVPVTPDEVRGKILVARTTDPGWVFLLIAAKGIIAEKGSLLSHTAIISRELGVPSVVGVPHITEYLKTGDRVHMDGVTGVIERILKP